MQQNEKPGKSLKEQPEKLGFFLIVGFHYSIWEE